MRAKELVARDTAGDPVYYATCDGQLVELLDDRPVANWTLAPVPRPGKALSWQDVQWAQVDVADPWGPCHVPAETRRRVVPAGIRARIHEVDGQGVPVEGRWHYAAVRPRDIKGTWKQYLSLHAEDLRRRSERVTRATMGAKVQRAVHDAVTRLLDGPISPRSWITIDDYRYVAGESDDLGFAVRLEQDDVIRLLAKAGIRLELPEGVSLRETETTRAQGVRG